MTRRSIIVLVVFLGLASALQAQNTSIYTNQGGTIRTYATGAVLNQDSGATFNLSGTTDIESAGSLNVKSGGIVVFEAGSQVTLATVTKTTTYTVLASESGMVYICNAAAGAGSFQLPATAAGLHYRFVVKTPVASGGMLLRPNSADKIMGNGFTSADNKFIINSAATDREGDMVEVVADGTDGWYITGVIGTWAYE